MDYDVIYIGSGNASWQGARFLRKAGLKILIIEKSLYGGACANRGCNSKALLDAPYEIKALADNFEGCGKSGDFNVNWPDLMKLKRKRIANMAPFLDGKFKEYGLDVAHGEGYIVDEHTVRVGDETFTTDKIVISTGLRPIIPDIKGFTDENSVHLDELSAEDYDKLMIILQDKINQVKRDKEKSLNIIVSNDSGSLFNGNAFITNSLSKDDAREKVISGVKDLMRKAEEEERDFSLEDLNDLEIDGYNISKNITSDRAIIVIDVYSFSIDENFAISDVE